MNGKLLCFGIFILIYLPGCYQYSPRNEMLFKASEYDKRGFHQTAASMREEAEELPVTRWAFGEETPPATVFYTSPPETGQYNFKMDISTFISNARAIKIRRKFDVNKLVLCW